MWDDIGVLLRFVTGFRGFVWYAFFSLRGYERIFVRREFIEFFFVVRGSVLCGFWVIWIVVW